MAEAAKTVVVKQKQGESVAAFRKRIAEAERGAPADAVIYVVAAESAAPSGRSRRAA
jgi:hypothetical protein